MKTRLFIVTMFCLLSLLVVSAGCSSASSPIVTMVTGTAFVPTSTVPEIIPTQTTTAITLVSIDVKPTSASLETGSTEQFTATAIYSNGSTEDVTSLVTWESDNTGVIVSPTGAVSGVNAGTSNIAATLSGITSTPVLLTLVNSADVTTMTPATTSVTTTIVPSTTTVTTTTTSATITMPTTTAVTPTTTSTTTVVPTTTAVTPTTTSTTTVVPTTTAVTPTTTSTTTVVPTTTAVTPTTTSTTTVAPTTTTVTHTTTTTTTAAPTTTTVTHTTTTTTTVTPTTTSTTTTIPTTTVTSTSATHINPVTGIYGNYYLGLVDTPNGTLSGDGCYDGTGDFIILINNKNATNPTYAQLVSFLQSDTTDEYPYIYTNQVGGSYYGTAESHVDLQNIQNIIDGIDQPKNPDVCADFAEMLHNDAEMDGIKCAYVCIDLSTGGHAIDAFQTTDKGLIYVDDTGVPAGTGPSRCVKTVSLAVGQEYQPVSLFPEAGWGAWDDMGTVISFQVYWDGTWNN